MNCSDCGTPTKVVKTLVIEDVTQRLRECRCGSRFLTAETIVRRLQSLPVPQVTPSQPPGNGSALSSSQVLTLVPSEADQTRTRVERIIKTFPVVASESPTWDLVESDHLKLVEAYPGVNALTEYAKIALWVDSNPTKRKTARGMMAFIQRWFEKAQNRGGASPMPTPKQAVPYHVDRLAEGTDKKIAELRSYAGKQPTADELAELRKARG